MGAKEHPVEIRKYLEKELKAGSIIGPLRRNPFGKAARFSPLDTRPKKDSDQLCIILNLSYPFGRESVNKSINKEVFDNSEPMDLHYPSVEYLAKIVRTKGVKSCIFKCDLSKAYCQLYMSPSSIHILGYWFEGECDFDVTLSKGSSSAAYCCQRTMNAITYVYQKKGFEDVNYLDDLGAAEVESRAEEAYDCLGWILDSIRIHESRHKACPPAYIMIFLGILFNTITMTMQITGEQLKEIKELIEHWLHKKSATLKDNTQGGTTTAGQVKLCIKHSPCRQNIRIKNTEQHKQIQSDRKEKNHQGHAQRSAVVVPLHGRLRGDINNAPGVMGCPGHDLQFGFFITRLQGMGSKQQSRCSGSIPCTIPRVAHRQGRRQHQRIRANHSSGGVENLANRIQNRNVLAYCDNEVSVKVVNSGKARNRFTQACLWEICLICTRNNEVLKLIHISSKCNCLSDNLSCWANREKRRNFFELTRGTKVKFRKINHELFEFTHDW